MLIVLAVLGLQASSVFSQQTNQQNSIVRFEFVRGTNALGVVDVELFDHDKPETVRNFLLYVRSGSYTNSFLHRAVPGFIVQGGGFALTNPASADRFSTYNSVTNFGRLTNEFLTGARMSNTLGTLAMAKLGDDPNSATSQWFFNLANNSANLDAQNGGFTVFGRVLPTVSTNDGLAVLEHFNRLSTNAGIVNLGSLIGSTYQVFSSLPVSYTNTTTRVPLYRELYTVNVWVLNETKTTGTAVPSIAVTSPAPNSLFTNQVVKIQGTSSDDREVARVVYRLGNGSREVASGTTNWEFSIQPPPGFQTVTVESIDWDGNFSAETSRTFFYQKTVPLNLRITGQGTVAGVRNGQELVPNVYYTATATPASGSIFAGWSGSVTSSTPTLSFQLPVAATNYSLTAKFIQDPLPNLAGTYHGLLQTLGAPDFDGAGFMKLTLQSDGYFSGNILYKGVSYNYTGKFDSAGNAVIGGIVGGVSRTISLTLQKLNASGVITGTFSGTSSTTLVQLERLAGSLPGSSASPGGYTFVMPNSAPATNTLVPGGNGFGTARLESTGVLNFSGVLGDGTSFTAAPKVSRLGRWPLYVELDGGKGALWGWVSYNTNPPVRLQAGLTWIRTANGAAPRYPAGFSNQVTMAASLFNTEPGKRVVNWVHGTVRLAGTDLIPSLTNVVKLSTNNTLEVLDPGNSGLKLSLDTTSGRVTGSFVHPWFKVTNSVRGSLLVASNYIRGQYINGSQVGNLAIDMSSLMVTQAISSVSLPALTTAISEGGVLQFQSDGVILVTNTLVPKFDTRIEANGHNVVISGGGAVRLFEVPTNVSFSMVGLTLASGFHKGQDGTNGLSASTGKDGFGGAIANFGGSLALTNCVITNCVVMGGDAGLDSSTNAVQMAGGGALGAAIYSKNGLVSLQGCSIAENMAIAGGNRSMTIPGAVSRGDAVGLGGGLYFEGGECRIFSSKFAANRAQGGPPMLLASGASARAGNTAGGALAITAGILQLNDTQVITNTAGGGFSTNSAGAGHAYAGGVFIETNVVAVIDGSLLQGNAAVPGSFGNTEEAPNALGGAIYNAGSLILTNCTLGQNVAHAGSSVPSGYAWGGAVVSSGPLVINRSTFHGNSALGGEATNGVAGAVAGGEGAGGAVYILGSSAAVTNTTFAHNVARGGAGANSQGGLTNAPGGPARGGAVAFTAGSANMVHVTLAFNEAVAGNSTSTNAAAVQGGALASPGGTLSIRSSILASNSPANLFGVATDVGYNISSDNSFGFTGSGSLTNVDTMITGLTTNGGFAPTIAILPQSPARDAVRGAFPIIDQRGTSRPQGLYADSGAYEFIQTVPIFTVQPAGTNVVRVGTNVIYQVQATGPGTIGYYWLKDGAPMPGATAAVLSITNVQIANAGSYSAVATNSFGSVTSTVATVVVDLRPLILTQPSDVVLNPGATTSLVVVATGPSLSYAWWHNQVVMEGATNATLPITAAVPGVDGTYQVIISNDAGSVTSRVASVTFSSSALSILTHPESATVAIGSPSAFAVLASGVSPIRYQWFKNNTLIQDATNNVYSIEVTTRTNSGNYRVVVSNPFLTLTSTTATLTVVASPTLSIAREGSAALAITCQGDAGRVHRLLTSTNVSGPTWVGVATNTIPANGSITWTLVTPTNAQGTYYRVTTP